LRARPKPLIAKGLSLPQGTLCRGGGSSYLLLPEPAEPPGLAGFFAAPLLEPGLEVPPAPDEVPLAPDEPVLPEEEVAPPDADLLPSRSHPAIRPPLRANTSAAANVVNFMLTSLGCVPITGSK
jgi:hypothetical protein